jgi:hypothetical protein
VLGAPSQGLSLGFLARDFGTTTFSGVPCPSVSRRPWPGTDSMGLSHRAGCISLKAGLPGSAFSLWWPAESVVTAAGTHPVQPIANGDRRKLRQHGEYRRCKCPSSGKAGGFAGSIPARAYPHFCATRHDAWLLI